ncbi:MAG: hypothetical protein RR201_02260 [Malacoplasma sp.]
MDKNSKKRQARLKSDLYDQASLSSKYKGIKSCIGLFNALGIKLDDMSCNFATNNIISQDCFDIACFYEDTAHTWENISIILDLDLDYDNMQQITQYSYYIFSILPNLSFIIFIHENVPYYIFKRLDNDKLHICFTKKLMVFA